MEGDSALNEAVIQHLRTTWKGQHDSLLEQVGVALGVQHTATSDCVLLELWQTHAKSSAKVCTISDLGQHNQPTQTQTQAQSAGPKYDQKAEEKFVEYIELLKKRGYFKNTEEGSAEYNERLQKARERYVFSNFSDCQDSSSNTLP